MPLHRHLGMKSRRWPNTQFYNITNMPHDYADGALAARRPEHLRCCHSAIDSSPSSRTARVQMLISLPTNHPLTRSRSWVRPNGHEYQKMTS